MRIAKFALVLSCVSVPALAQEVSGPTDEKRTDTDITLLAGADYTSGDFNGQDYETTAVSAGIAARMGRLSFGASLPYVSTSAPEELIVSSGGLFGTPLFAQPSTQTREVTREGIGDLTVQAGYQLPLGSVNAFVGSSVKLPTASREKGLGTGEVDVGVSGELSRRFGEVIPFVTASYTFIGEPEEFAVRDTLSGAAGSHFLLGDKSSISVSYAYQQSASELVEDQQSVGLGLSTALSTRLQLGAEARAGLSEGAPDARLGLKLGVGF